MSQSSVVVFRVEYGAGGSLDEDLAMLTLFGETPGVSLKSNSTTIYQAANYDHVEIDGTNCWFGEMFVVRNVEGADIKKDERGRFLVGATGSSQSIDGRPSQMLYNTERHLLTVVERTDLPYTRFVTYVKQAVKHHLDHRIPLRLVPVQDARPIREQLEAFETFESLVVEFRHSQSPGHRSADDRVERLRARNIRTSISAERGKTLNRDEILRKPPPEPNDGELPLQSRGPQPLPEQVAIEHIVRNQKNGTIEVVGTVGAETIKYSSARPVLRRRAFVEVGNADNPWVATLHHVTEHVDESDVLDVEDDEETLDA